jgi:ABC-type glycerol-3-phosphate transport system substrate-binding protein
MAGYLADSGAKELKLVPVPSDDPDNLGLFLKPSMLMVASAKTKYKDAAARFIDFMVNDPEVGQIFKTSRGVPASKTQRDGTTFEGTDKLVVDYEKSIEKYLKDAPSRPSSASAPSKLRSSASVLRPELRQADHGRRSRRMVQGSRRPHQAERLIRQRLIPSFHN